jgi:hypothetical protein
MYESQEDLELMKEVSLPLKILEFFGKAVMALVALLLALSAK